MPEDEYERRIGSRDGLGEGETVFRLFQHFGGNPDGVALELGAGSGALSIGFITAARRMEVLITDPSVAFLRLTQEKLKRAEVSFGAVTFGTLLAEDISRLPHDSMDLIFLQACLHHVSDYRRFLIEAAQTLKPGGVLILHEPFAEGYLMMAVAVELMLGLDGRAYTLSPDDRHKLGRVLDAIYFQSDRLARKDDAEDKHCFFTDDLLTACWSTYSEARFLRNQSFASIASVKDLNDISLHEASRASMVDYLRSFLVHHHLLSDAGAIQYDQFVGPSLARIDRLFRQGDGPAMYATVICKRAVGI